MTALERLEAVFSGKRPDRIPTLGGWIPYPQHLIEISGCTEADYISDPKGVALKAYKKLECDACLDVFISGDIHEYREVNNETGTVKNVYTHSGKDIEDLAFEIDALPGPDEVMNCFDFETAYAEFKKQLEMNFELYGDMVYMPAQFRIGGHAAWYHIYGYENYFLLAGLYPDLLIKLFEIGGVEGYNRSLVLAKAVKEGLYPHAVLMGEDLCTQRGPMISVEFLEKYFAPTLKRGLQPLLEVGCRPVWHCDGDVRKILPMLIECGIEGFQGFQPECNVDLDLILQQRPISGNKPLIFGPLSVTSELPFMSPEEVEKRVFEVAEKCEGKADLVLFTSNTVLSDVSTETIKAMFGAASKYRY